MSFLGIGPGELVLILIIAVIVLGPEKIPEVARTIGKMTRELKKITEGFETELRRELDEAAKVKDQAQKELNALTSLPDGTAKATQPPEEQPALFVPEEYRSAPLTVGEDFADSATSLSPAGEERLLDAEPAAAVGKDNGREPGDCEVVASQVECAPKES